MKNILGQEINEIKNNSQLKLKTADDTYLKIVYVLGIASSKYRFVQLTFKHRMFYSFLFLQSIGITLPLAV